MAAYGRYSFCLLVNMQSLWKIKTSNAGIKKNSIEILGLYLHSSLKVKFYQTCCPLFSRKSIKYTQSIPSIADRRDVGLVSLISEVP